MVLESMISPFKAERNPKQMILWGILYNSISILISLWVFHDYSSLVMVFLTSLLAVPLIYNTIKLEEQKDESIVEEVTLLKEHGKALAFFVYLFFGFVLSTAIWYVFIDSSHINVLFDIQLKTITQINGGVTGFTFAVNLDTFYRILLNNLKVLFFCTLFAFVFGVGAIFVLTWNATIIGVAIGNFIRSNLAQYATLVGLEKVGGYFGVFSIGFLKYAIHGIPEILAYFTGGLGASIIGVAMLRHSLDYEKFKHVLLDSTDLLLLSLVLVFVAAFLEVFVTPNIFF